MKKCKANLFGWPATRAELLLQRLHEREYYPESLVVPDSGWPGDYEGRAFLALVMLSALRGEKAPNYDAVLNTIWKNRNIKGYMGPILTDGFNEQQMSGNSWLLRAMCEAYSRFKEPRAKQMICDIVENLLLPTVGNYSFYPTDKTQRSCDKLSQSGLAGKKDIFAFSDDTDGNDEMQLVTCLTGKVGPWYISTDVGCAFIMLDGVTAAFACMKGHMPDNRELIEQTRILIREMCDVFLKLEFVRMSVQTHATLSGLRGVMRFALLENDSVLVAKVREIFDLYQREGMTENYENYNWFSRPVHTEPCGTIDSFILAYWLWEYSGEYKYIQLANRILYNGIIPTQRHNGGFGLHLCAGADTVGLKPPQSGICEAHWCCTMRGGEFFEKLWDFAARQDADKLILPILLSENICGDGFEMTVSTAYPKDNCVTISLKNNKKLKYIGLYLPIGATDIQITDVAENIFRLNRSDDGFVWIAVDGDKTFDISFVLDETVESTVNINSVRGQRKFKGDLLLGKRKGLSYEPFYDMYWRFGEKAAEISWQVVEEVENQKLYGSV